MYVKLNFQASENQTELLSLVADTLWRISNTNETIVAIKGETVASNNHIETKYLEPCKKEEADDRMFLHALEMSRLGLKKLLIVTVDTYVVVIALYAFWDLSLEELWNEFGREKTVSRCQCMLTLKP